MNELTFTVKITVDGDPDEMFKLVSQYLTLTDYPFLVDYGPDAWGGYEGPRIRNGLKLVTKKRSSPLKNGIQFFWTT